MRPGAYDYFTFHTSYLDAGFRWHQEWDVDYGRPLAPAQVVRRANPGSGGGSNRGDDVYTRNYTKCFVRVTCPPLAASGGSCDAQLTMHDERNSRQQ